MDEAGESIWSVLSIMEVMGVVEIGKSLVVIASLQYDVNHQKTNAINELY
jgi:hypothetical protein